MVATQMDTDAQIFLQNKRGEFQTIGYRSFYTFNFGDYQAENRAPSGNLLVLNDETLLPQCSAKITVNEPVQIILLPLVGAIEIGKGNRDVQYLNSGESLSFIVKPDEHVEITNPYPVQAINYLQIRLLLNDLTPQNSAIKAFDLNDKNTLIPLLNAAGDQSNLVIGKYEGRKDGLYVCKNPVNQVFIFIIEGAFEVQDRLLEKRDGLLLQRVREVEFEALSSNAIILILETAN
jgi:hypothetical protein